MRILADVHISPKTVQFLNDLGIDVERSTAYLPATASDEEIIGKAIELGRAILTRDLGFPKLLITSGRFDPSLILLRTSSERLDHTHRALANARSELQAHVGHGYIVIVEDDRVRVRSLTYFLGE